MGPVATAVAVGCLRALGALMFVAAGLIILLIVVQQLRADPQAQPAANATLALFLAMGGLACTTTAKWLVKRFNAS